MSFSKKALFSEINEKCGSHKDEGYLKNAIAIIDTTLDHANVDSIFLDEYYVKDGTVPHVFIDSTE